jgi:hypothetical protein
MGTNVHGVSEPDWRAVGQQAVNSLLLAAMHLSPTIEEQKQFTMMANEMRMQRENDKAVCVALLQTMLDGVRYGNWFGGPVVEETPS